MCGCGGVRVGLESIWDRFGDGLECFGDVLGVLWKCFEDVLASQNWIYKIISDLPQKLASGAAQLDQLKGDLR